MISRKFGPTGIKVPVIGQGTWALHHEQKAETALRLGLELDLSHIDTAEMYTGSEEIVGRAISDSVRDQLFIVSKVMPSNASYAGTMEAAQTSLAKMNLDRMDVYLLHAWSEEVDECMRAMGELIDQGKVGWAGVSNFDLAQMERAQDALGSNRLACNQVRYNLNHRDPETELLDYCRREEVALVGYCPFRGGFPKAGSNQAKVLEKIATSHEATPGQVILNFLTRFDPLFAIPKAENPDHVRSNSSAVDFTLDDQDLARIEEAFPVR